MNGWIKEMDKFCSWIVLEAGEVVNHAPLLRVHTQVTLSRYLKSYLVNMHWSIHCSDVGDKWTDRIGALDVGVLWLITLSCSFSSVLYIFCQVFASYIAQVEPLLFFTYAFFLQIMSLALMISQAKQFNNHKMATTPG